MLTANQRRSAAGIQRTEEFRLLKSKLVNLLRNRVSQGWRANSLQRRRASVPRGTSNFVRAQSVSRGTVVEDSPVERAEHSVFCILEVGANHAEQPMTTSRFLSPQLLVYTFVGQNLRMIWYYSEPSVA